MGFKKSLNPKTTSIRLRVTPEEKSLIELAAQARLLDVSEFLVKRGLGKPTPVQFEHIAICVLERMIADLKAIYRDAGRRECDDLLLKPLVTEMVTAILALWKQRGRS